MKISKTINVSTSYVEEPTRLKPSQSVVLLLTPSHLLIFASRAACPISGTIFLRAFQPKGRSETPLYKENSRGLSISYVAFISDGSYLLLPEPLCRKDEVLGGGVGAGAVVTEVAKDKASDTLVLLLSVICADILPITFAICLPVSPAQNMGRSNGKLNGRSTSLVMEEVSSRARIGRVERGVQNKTCN
jgi:hypothetical protein